MGSGAKPQQLSGFTTFEVLRKASADIIHAVWVGLCLLSSGEGVCTRFASIYLPQITRYNLKTATVASVVNLVRSHVYHTERPHTHTRTQTQHTYTDTHNRFNGFKVLSPGPPRWAGAKRELLDFMVQEKINRGRHTDHPAGRHSIRTNQCPPPPSPHFLQAGCPSCHPIHSVKALKATALKATHHWHK